MSLAECEPRYYRLPLRLLQRIADWILGRMSQTSERRRKPRQKPERGPEPVWVTLLNVPGASGEVRGKVLDHSDVGVGIEIPIALQENAFIVVQGLPNGTGPNGKVRARVVRCWSAGDSFHAGLAYDEVRGAQQTSDEVPDYYEVLQISPNADPDMIHRVYRLLAQRYHPDNTETGDETAFRKIMDAYKTLSDPEKRAAYDVNLHTYRQIRWKIFDQKQALNSKMAEKSKRRGILDLLYNARRQQPATPTMTLHELEDLLGCPREHLEFSLWYLKENALIARADNGRVMITAKGVDWAEAEEAEQIREDRLLQAASTEHAASSAMQ